MERLKQIQTKTEQLLMMKEAARYRWEKKVVTSDQLQYMITDLNTQIILLQTEKIEILIGLGVLD